MYDDVIDVTKLTNFALKKVIDEKLNAFNDALNEIGEESENGDGESENANRHGWIRDIQHAFVSSKSSLVIFGGLFVVKGGIIHLKHCF